MKPGYGMTPLALRICGAMFLLSALVSLIDSRMGRISATLDRATGEGNPWAIIAAELRSSSYNYAEYMIAAVLCFGLAAIIRRLCEILDAHKLPPSATATTDGNSPTG